MRRMLWALLLAVGMGLSASMPAFAVLPDEVLDDPALEQQARALSSEIRCLVCQNESIDVSHAELARDLRILVRERLVAGDSDQQVLDFLVARYGDFVLLKPPVNRETLLLWFGPALVLLIAGGVIILRIRSAGSRISPSTIPLSEDEKARLEALLASDQR